MAFEMYSRESVNDRCSENVVSGGPLQGVRVLFRLQ